ncbi:Hybrid signal transduction histidine kinase A [Cladobotryum mycophilum]|uniref:histidine kinase n=1 Tax=Cladobotryum mycophilum TaxID=491253 RepID=A0ABR0SSS9_9HYPO
MKSRNPPVKVVSEAVRERETFKYEPHLFADVQFNSSGQLLPGSKLTTSKDTVLTALTQLGVYQTGTERGFVSVFDTSHQYIIAEAVPLMPLTPGLSSDYCPIPLSLCGTAIPRAHGTCEHVLYNQDGSKPGEPEDATELPLSLVHDLTADSRFSSKPYCQFGESGQFYAAVPIRTLRGINIGSYCVTSSTKIESWDSQCVQSLRGISRAIAEHLETNRLKHAYRRNERMNRGLGSFIEGKSTLSGWQLGPNVTAFMDRAQYEGALDATQQDIARQDQEDEEEEGRVTSSIPPSESVLGLRSNVMSTKRPDVASEVNALRPVVRQSVGYRSIDYSSSASSHRVIEEPNLNANNTSLIFSRAANIIREAFEVAGCMFFDVTLGSYRAPATWKPFVGDPNAAANTVSSTSSGSDDPAIKSPANPPDAICETLGFSTSDASSINAATLGHDQGTMHRQFLAKLLRRYPNGKIFNFDVIGELQTSGSSEDEAGLAAPTEELSSIQTDDGVDGGHSTATKRRRVDKRFSRIKEGALIHQVFPAARSVAFVPIWDSKRERWLAGGFVYTLTPTRVFTVEGELSFLKAFTKIMAAEVHSFETQQADQAKSDALGALSHELRSPLHGAILSTELLNYTELNVFQGNATHTIETCCRTLLDTIDHLLDYSKINTFAAKRKQEVNETSPRLRKRATSDQFGKKRLYCNVRLDRLVEEVAESLFAGFNFQRISVRQIAKQGSRSTYADTAAHNRLDSAKAMEQLSPTAHGEGEYELPMVKVLVYISIDPTCDWMFNLQPGAIRRIVMNLFGNSLKYTTSGAIRISLSQEVSSIKRRQGKRLVRLTVQDTGKGISEDYLRHNLFKPFLQEDELQPGTGLGLSLVKSIVSQLQGHITVESQVGAGTTINVTLPLEQASLPVELPKEDAVFEEQVHDLTRLRVWLSGFESWDNNARVGDGRRILEDICRHSLHLELISVKEAKELAPDIVLWSDDALARDLEATSHQFSKAPNVVICQDAMVTYERYTTQQSMGQEGVFEFISQPIGPRKLARAIHLAVKRWMGLHKHLPPLNRPPAPNRSRSSFGMQQSTKEQTQDAAHPPRRDLTMNSIFPSIEMPINVESLAPSTQTAPPEQGTVAESGVLVEPSEPITREKILLVDDNHINLKVLSAYMGRLKHSYETATNGKEAVDKYLQHPYQFKCILMDISMPVMDGLEATRQIRAYEHTHHLPPAAILALTGLASDSTHQAALESGVDVFLTKPVRLKTLGEVLGSMNIITPDANG